MHFEQLHDLRIVEARSDLRQIVLKICQIDRAFGAYDEFGSATFLRETCSDLFSR